MTIKRKFKEGAIMDQLISVSDMNKELAIPETTIRRYLKIFKSFMPQSVKLGRTKKYPIKVMQLCQVIQKGFDLGLSEIEVQHKLSGEDITTLQPSEGKEIIKDSNNVKDTVKKDDFRCAHWQKKSFEATQFKTRRFQTKHKVTLFFVKLFKSSYIKLFKSI